MQSSHFTVGHCDEILPGIYLGSLFATSPDSLSRHQIQAVLNVAGHKTSATRNYPLRDHLVFEIDDVPDAANQMIKKVFPTAFKFLDKYGHPKSPHKIPLLVHCAAGVSRSTTVLTAWIMKSFNLSLDESLTLIRKRRPIVNPNYGFIQILKEYENFLRRWRESRPTFRQHLPTSPPLQPPSINASENYFKTQTSYLTPINNHSSTFNNPRYNNPNDGLSLESMVGAPIRSELIDDPLPNKWRKDF